MKPKFLPPLTGLRGAVALWVVAFHLSNFLPIRHWPIVRGGWMGVDVFFILSGFILAHVHLREFEGNICAGAVRRFLALRLSRIYPVHLVALLAACAFATALIALHVHLTARFSVGALAANVVLVQAWGFFTHDTFNVLAWSISAEWLAYLAFPMLALFIVRLRPRVAIGCAVLALATEIAALRLLGRGLFVTSGLAPVRVAGEFVAGMCLFTVFRSGTFDALPWGLITDAAAVGMAIIVLLGGTFAALPLMAAIVVGLAVGRGVLAKTLSTRAAIILGEVSYSLYMVHLLVLEGVYAPIEYSRFAANVTLRILALPAGLAAVVVATALMHHYVEVPCRRTMLRALGRMRIAPLT